MTSSESRIICITALVSILALEVGAQAPQPAGTSSASTPQPRAMPGARRHLDDAARLLNSIADESFKGDARKRVAQLRRDFAQLAEAYNTNPEASVEPILSRDGTHQTEDPLPVTWKNAFTVVERDLAGLIGVRSMSSGASGSTGAAASADVIGVKNLDPEVRKQFEEFRLHVELFFAAAALNLESEAAR